jgi:hypothetical protein
MVRMSRLRESVDPHQREIGDAVPGFQTFSRGSNLCRTTSAQQLALCGRWRLIGDAASISAQPTLQFELPADPFGSSEAIQASGQRDCRLETWMLPFLRKLMSAVSHAETRMN